MDKTLEKINRNLAERVKELNCLYNVLKVSSDINKTFEDIFLEIAEIMVNSWQYPEVAVVEINFDGKKYKTSKDGKIFSFQSTPLIVNNCERGSLKISYLKQMPDEYEGPFLKEERLLLNAVAKQISIVVKNKELFNEKNNLLLNLRHADKLATIGQLSAGVAHELNEPLANILGYAELLNKKRDFDSNAKDFLNEIIQSVLYAREITSKLLLFSRKVPTNKDELLDINSVIKKDLLFLVSRCEKENIAINFKLASSLPKINVEKSLIIQIFTNLIVNGIQAINHDRGSITITTSSDLENICFSVKDNGTGIKEEYKKNIFEPFFTTKGEENGTGLGLSVVYGIISALKGQISFESKESEYTTFFVKLPLE